MLLLLLGLWCSHLAAAVDVADGWEYRWGDSPFVAGAPLWPVEAAPEAWSSIEFPSNPPGREGRENVWFRVVLPEGEWRDPVLYIYSVDLIVEVYQEGRRLYHYGDFDAAGRGRFIGWPWHMIPLPAGSTGKPLYFRIFSDYQDIGLWGEVKLMERVELLRYVVNNSLGELVIGGFCLLVALLALLALPVIQERRTILAVALLAGSGGGMAIGSCQARLLLLDHALFWDYLAAASYFVTPIAMALLLEPWFTGRWRQLYRGLQLFFVGYLALAAGLWASSQVAVSDTYPVFDLLFLVALPLLLTPPLLRIARLGRQQKAILAAFVLHSLVLLLSMAVAHGLLPWALVPLSAGALAFSLVIIAASLYRYASTRQALAALNHSLEVKVQARTAELEALAEQERARGAVLAFEGEKRGVLQEITTALQRCESLDEAMTELCRMLPGFCSPIGGALYALDVSEACYRRVTQWGAKVEFPPELSAVEASAMTEAHAPRWVFPIRIEHSQLGDQTLGLLVLDTAVDEQLEPGWFDRTMLHCLLKMGTEKINLTLSIVGLQEALSRYSYEDALTGLRNRRYLDEWLQHEIALAQRNRTPLSVIVCDIDHFKRFNDAYGHLAGDDALRLVAVQLRAVFRQTDIVCRYGGEEFVVIMPTASLEACHERAEELRRAVRAVPVLHRGRNLGYVTLSAGIATWPEQMSDPAGLLGEADKALYRAKQQGRDRVEGARGPVATPVDE